MARNTLVIAPHPDDEVLGVGGTLLRYGAEGCRLGWLIVTGVSAAHGWSEETVKRRAEEIAKVRDIFGFESVFELDFPTTKLDQLPMSQLVSGFSQVFKSFEPETVFVPHPSDVHTDHKVVFNAAASCAKWFRYPSVRRVLAYETLSETEFGIEPGLAFRPNVFVDIAPFLEKKMDALGVYASELGAFPFPRSLDAVRALATLRGSASGFKAAEAFELLMERA
jgi:LmbE family N-acetylglucosaminyl deacetylase